MLTYANPIRDMRNSLFPYIRTFNIKKPKLIHLHRPFLYILFFVLTLTRDETNVFIFLVHNMYYSCNVIFLK